MSGQLGCIDADGYEVVFTVDRRNDNDYGPMDLDSNGRVNVDELIAAVQRWLGNSIGGAGFTNAPLSTAKGGVVGTADGITALDWDRRLDDTSEANITISANSDCCSAFLGDLEPWVNGIEIYRQGQLVWDGPIVLITYSNSEIAITARDVSALWSRRFLAYDFIVKDLIENNSFGLTDYQLPPTGLFLALLTFALEYDRHGTTLDFKNALSSTGFPYVPSYDKYDGPIRGMLDSIAADYIDWTVLGRKVIIRDTAGGETFGQTALLMCDDFLNVGMTVTKNGLALGTQVAVVGDDIVVNGIKTPNVGIAQTFPSTAHEDPFYGLLQLRRNANQNFLTAQASQDAADGILAGAYPYPRQIGGLDSMQLNPNAPVSIADLVPGVSVPIVSDCLCVQTSANFTLSNVKVKVDPEGETVAITLLSAGASNAGRFSGDSSDNI